MHTIDISQETVAVGFRTIATCCAAAVGMRALIVSAALLALTACVSLPEQSMAECQSLGLQFGTPAYANCYEQVMARHAANVNALILAQ